MNKDRIAALLKDPARVAREDLAGLREFRDRYPWFSGAHLLIALGEHAEGEVLFEETLKTTAAHIPSRELLWDRVQGSGLDPKDAAQVAQAPEAGSHQAAPPAGPSQAEAPSGTMDPPPFANEDIAQRILDQQILEAAAAGAYVLEQQVASTPSAFRPVPPPEPPTLPPSPPGPAETLNAPRSFTSWLDAAPVAPLSDLRSDRSPVANEEAADPLRHSGAEGGNSPEATRPATTPGLTRDLIDRFLVRTAPEPRKAEFFDPQQAAKRSLADHADLVTETLARIHEKQGRWAKAAAAYRHLAVKHPGKSGYFAALAKNAEEQLNK